MEFVDYLSLLYSNSSTILHSDTARLSIRHNSYSQYSMENNQQELANFASTISLAGFAIGLGVNIQYLVLKYSQHFPTTNHVPSISNHEVMAGTAPSSPGEASAVSARQGTGAPSEFHGTYGFDEEFVCHLLQY